MDPTQAFPLSAAISPVALHTLPMPELVWVTVLTTSNDGGILNY